MMAFWPLFSAWTGFSLYLLAWLILFGLSRMVNRKRRSD
jgi:cytochrome bd-type quinol oxidase subunit 2